MSAERKPPEQGEFFNPMECDAVDLIEHLGDNVPPQHNWAPLLAELFSVFEAHSKRNGMDAEAAALDARDRCILLAEYLGGRLVYLPKNESLKLALRNALIWRQFTGHNVRDLAARWELNEIHVYEILREQRALNMRKLQGRLFEDEPAR
jgi:Mor family transcriptional regulator